MKQLPKLNQGRKLILSRTLVQNLFAYNYTYSKNDMKNRNAKFDIIQNPRYTILRFHVNLLHDIGYNF